MNSYTVMCSSGSGWYVDREFDNERDAKRYLTDMSNGQRKVRYRGAPQFRWYLVEGRTNDSGVPTTAGE